MNGRVIVGVVSLLVPLVVTSIFTSFVTSFVACAKPPQPKVCEAPPREAPKESSYLGMCTLDVPPEPPMSTAAASSDAGTSDAGAFGIHADASGDEAGAEHDPPK